MAAARLNTGVLDRLRVAEPAGESWNTEVRYHKNCYSVFTSAALFLVWKRKKVEERAKSSEEEMPGPSNKPRRASRRSIHPLNKKLCIFCQTETGKATCLLMQIDVSKEIMEAAKKISWCVADLLTSLIWLLVMLFTIPNAKSYFYVKLTQTSLMKQKSQKQFTLRNSWTKSDLGWLVGSIYFT